MDEEERTNKIYSIMNYFEYEIRRQLVEGGIPEEAIRTANRCESVGWKIYFYLKADKISDEELSKW
jgi:hypothetical protein